MTEPTAALVLETNNLQGGDARRRDAVASLERLLVHLGAQTRPLASLAEVVVTHEGFTPAECARLARAARGVAVRFLALPPGTGYYAAKNAGFDATRADVVAFGDSDCWPDAAWLERLLAPFAHRDVAIVAGRTCYRSDLLGTAATTIDFMYFVDPRRADARRTRNFYANNVAFRREVFAAHRYVETEGFYRGNCQTLGMRLHASGVGVRFEPAARTTHRFPDDAREFVRLRLHRGADAVQLYPSLAAAYVPLAGARLARLGPVTTAVGFAARFACSVASLGRQEMPSISRAQTVACVGLIAGISALDAAGAVAAHLGVPSARRRARAAPTVALSYHGDKDRLADAA
jgi:hypothetical protein